MTETDNLEGYLVWFHYGPDPGVPEDEPAPMFYARVDDGRSAEVRATADYLQWRHVGDDEWRNLATHEEVTQRFRETLPPECDPDVVADMAMSSLTNPMTDGFVSQDTWPPGGMT